MTSKEHRGANILRDLNPLAIARITIGLGQPQLALSSPDSKLPDSVRQIGKFLLSMLHIEYEK